MIERVWRHMERSGSGCTFKTYVEIDVLRDNKEELKREVYYLSRIEAAEIVNTKDS